jgi:DNA polymerase III alpha subunit
VGEGRITTSLVAHVLGLTEINPLNHDLEFTGLREEGEVWPRLGLTLASRSVPAAERHLKMICGETRVARASEISTERPRNLRRALCQWAGFADNQTAKAMSTWPKRTISLAEAQRAWDQEAGESELMPRTVPRMVLAYLAQAINPRRLPPQLLGGEIIVSGVDLTQILPLQRHEESMLPVTQLDSRSLDRLGLLRINLHTLPALDIIDHATEWVRREERAEFDPAKIPFDDHDTWALIGRGLTTGIPGLDRITIKSDLRSIQPRTLAELVEVMEDHLPPQAEGKREGLPPVAEATLALRCAHLKTHHPVSFLAAMFTAHHTNRQLLRVLLREATALKIRLLAPDINTSHFEFTQEGGAIRAGLMCIQGMTRHAFAAIERARRSGAFQDIHDLWARVDQSALPLRILTNLVKGGVLDSLDTRSTMLGQIAMLSRGIRRAPPGSPQTPDLFDASEAAADAPTEPVDEQTLSRYMRQVLGTVLTQDPLAPHQDLIRRTRSISPAEIQTADAGDEITVIGCVDHSMRASLIGDEEPCLILDLEGQVVVVPPEVSSDLSETLVQGEPFLIHGPVTRRGHERILRAHCVVPVSKVERVARAVSSIALNLAGENKRTVKLLLALCQQHPGNTQIEILGMPEGVSRRLVGKLGQTRVHFSPPLQFGLRKILPEDAIKVQQRALGEVAESV